MYFTTPSTIFIAQLLAAMQVLMTLDMPLSTTMALPVTSKPIESTVENLAWQAWIELPPEIKQQVKSRKVTPKSIFTLPNRIDCPEGHKQVDTKCIPIVIGTNADLIALNYLSLLAGNSPTDEQYDYDDVMEDGLNMPMDFEAQMQVGEVEKTVEGLTVELKPPSNDEPLKFNIFENKFNIFHEEPLEDYSSISNEGEGQESEKEKNIEVRGNFTLNSTAPNVTAINDLVAEPSNISQSNVENSKTRETLSTPWDSELAESNTLTSLADTTSFKIDAISLPASGLEQQKPHKLSIFQKDASLQLVTTVMDAEIEVNQDEKEQKKQQQQQDNDIQTLLQTESLLPLIHQATATTLLNTPLAESSHSSAVSAASSAASSASSPPSSSLTTMSLEEESSADSELHLNIGEDEEMTTLPNIMEQVMETKDKIEYTRSVTMNPLISDGNDINGVDNDDADDKDTTLDTLINDEPLEFTSTTIQFDGDTTMYNENIEETTSMPDSLSSSFASADSIDLSRQQELKELLLKQEQAFKDFEELQRMRKGQTDQHVVLKKSKVEPVEVLSTAATTTATKTTIDMPTTKTMDELITAATETVTPLLTVHNNENDQNNDRFYYQHFAKQDLEITTTNNNQQPATTKTATATTPAATATKTTLSEIETMPTTVTSEIDLAEELRLINELVKGIRPGPTTTKTTAIKTKTPLSTTTTTTKTTEIISLKAEKDNEEGVSPSGTSSTSESSLSTLKPTLSTSQIWSKIMPLLTTPQEKDSSAITHTATESLTETSKSSNDIKTATETTNRSHRNSKIIRINGFNTISSTTTPTTTSTTTEEPPSSATPTAPNAYEPYWWLPVAWRLDKPITTETQQPEQEVNKEEEQPLLLRLWAAYHAPKSS